MSDLLDRCCWRRCRASADMTYFEIGICDLHYQIVGEIAEQSDEAPRATLRRNVIPEAAAVLRRASTPSPGGVQ